MRVAAVVTDLLLFSRIELAAAAAAVELVRVDEPADLAPDLDLILVDWAARGPGWDDGLRDRSAQVVLFGPHTDLEAHAAARSAGLGPMWARSKLVAELPRLLRDPAARPMPGT
jgi:hypothetical protein